MKALDYLRILKYNIKIIFGINIIAAVALVTLTPIFFNLKLVTYGEIAQTGELYLSILGIILLTHICSIEDGYNVKELVYIRRIPFVLQFLIRLLTIFSVIFLLQLVIVISCKILGGIFGFIQISVGIWITSLFLGMIGLTVSNITNDIKSGYLVAFAYYMFEFFTRGRYTSDIYLFSLLNNSFSQKYSLLALMILAIVLNSFLVWKRS